MQPIFRAIDPRCVKLLPSIFQERFDLNRTYMLSLSNANLLQNYYLEAGLHSFRQKPEGIHWGWESPTCELRGHFLGHWLSAAAQIYATTGDIEIKAKADTIVSELHRCQEANGGEWAGPIPEKYLDRIAAGRRVWAPHYTLHKTLMGLTDMHALTGNQQALEILINWAEWFYRWTGQFSREQLDDILDVETGGMLEIWASLYAVTQRPEHLELMQRYDRSRFFEPLRDGKDVLTNKHANTTIPEVLGAARAWEVTGDTRWREIVDAYWRMAVTERGSFCTGGQTCGEVWTPPHKQAARLGDKNQEHCTVYNMMLLADWLYRWTGDTSYADYWERNLYNGILAQQNAQTGMIAYFLPLEAGARKQWGSPTDDFWCCHGTLVQAHGMHTRAVYYDDAEGLIVSQYIPTELIWERAGVAVRVTQRADGQGSAVERPDAWAVQLTIAAEQPVAFTLRLRLPAWLADAPTVLINGERIEGQNDATGFLSVQRTWHNDQIQLVLPKHLSSYPLPDQPTSVAFMDGPIVLAGLCDTDRSLVGDSSDPRSLLTPDNEREWGSWMTGYRTYNQTHTIRFLPLYQVQDQQYTVYFPVRPAE